MAKLTASRTDKGAPSPARSLPASNNRCNIPPRMPLAGPDELRTSETAPLLGAHAEPSSDDSVVELSSVDGVVDPGSTDGIADPGSADGVVDSSSADGIVDPSSAGEFVRD